MSINDHRSVTCSECGSHAVWVEDGFSASTYDGLRIGQAECECQCECDGQLVIADDEGACALRFQPNDFPGEVLQLDLSHVTPSTPALRFWSESQTAVYPSDWARRRIPNDFIRIGTRT